MGTLDMYFDEETKARDDISRIEAAIKFSDPDHVVLREMLKADLRRAEMRLSVILNAMEATE